MIPQAPPTWWFIMIPKLDPKQKLLTIMKRKKRWLGRGYRLRRTSWENANQSTLSIFNWPSNKQLVCFAALLLTACCKHRIAGAGSDSVYSVHVQSIQDISRQMGNYSWQQTSNDNQKKKKKKKTAATLEQTVKITKSKKDNAIDMVLVVIQPATSDGFNAMNRQDPQ